MGKIIRIKLLSAMWSEVEIKYREWRILSVVSDCGDLYLIVWVKDQHDGSRYTTAVVKVHQFKEEEQLMTLDMDPDAAVYCGSGIVGVGSELTHVFITR